MRGTEWRCRRVATMRDVLMCNGFATFTHVSPADGAIWRGDDELETLVRFAML